MKTPHVKRKAWLLAPVLCAIVLVLAMWRVQGPDYKRFVSAPLKDGTRYTFLYPARYIVIPLSGADVTMRDKLRLAPMERLREKLSRYKSLAGGLSASQLDANVMAQEGAPKNSREVMDDDSPPRWRETIINDARSKRQFILSHSNFLGGVEPFAYESSAVSQSFQILPPGAPVPTP